MQPQYSEKASKNVFTLQIKKDLQPITIRSNFDSGNIHKLELGLNNSIILTPAHDCAGTEY